MRLGVPDVTFDWREGRFFDLWMYAHVVGGLPFGLLALYLGYGRGAYLAAIGIFVAWEVFEKLCGGYEIIENKIVDVIAGTLGFALAYELFLGYPGPIGLLALAAFAVSTGLNAVGWAHRLQVGGGEDGTA